MNIEDKIKFHSERAMAEFDLALRAGNSNAARAHFGLSALHMNKMQVLGEKPEPEQATKANAQPSHSS